MEKLKTPLREDEPVRSRQGLKAKTRTMEHALAYMFPIAAMFGVVALILAIVVLRTAKPEVREFFYYINEEGMAVAQESAEAIPTIHQTEQFLQACIRKTFSLNSAEYREQLEEASYCFNSISFEQYAGIDAVRIMEDIFTKQKARGFTFTSDLRSRFLFDSSTAPEDSNCYAPQIEQLEHAVDCRAFRVDFRQNIRYLGQETRVGHIDRSMLVEIFVVPRTRSVHGMYVFRYQELRDQ